MDDESLGEEGFHKPAGVEEVRMGETAENENHYKKRQIVENGTDRADEQDETTQVANGPLARAGQPFGVYLVGGDGGLGKIVEQVIRKNLDRQHG